MDAREGRKCNFATHIIEAAVGLDCPLALQVVGEFYAAVTAKIKLDAKDAAARAAQLIAGFEIFGYSVHAEMDSCEPSQTGRVVGPAGRH